MKSSDYLFMALKYRGDDLKPEHRACLLMLADHVNADGYCWPSFKTLAAELCVKKRTAVRYVNALVDHGFLIKEHRLRGDGTYTTNRYRLSRRKLRQGVVPNLTLPSDKSGSTKSDTRGSDSSDTTGSAKSDTRGSAKSDTSNEPTQIEPTQIEPGGFVFFIENYPTKHGRAEAKRAWEELAPDPDLVGAMCGALNAQILWREQRAGTGEFIPAWPNPARWIREKRWEDQLTTSSGHAPRPQLPRNDQDLEAFAKTHGLAPARVGEQFPQFRARLQSELDQRA